MPDLKPAPRLFDQFFEFEKLSRSNSRLSLLLGRATEMYQSLPGALSASLFLLNEETFELEHSNTVPLEERKQSHNTLQELLEQGAIGKALSFGEIQSVAGLTESGGDYLVIPLLGSTAPVGVILVPLQAGTSAYEQELIDQIGIVSATFANIFVGRRLNAKLQKSREILEQKVATKTMKLYESRHSLFEKLRSFRSSITMSIPHEIMTPMNQIMGFSELLKESSGPIESEDNQEAVTYIYEAARRLNHLFENYIYFNELNVLASDIGKLKELKDAVTESASHIIERLLDGELADSDRKRDLSKDVADVSLAMSEDHFRKIVQELISNCIKYSKPEERL